MHPRAGRLRTVGRVTAAIFLMAGSGTGADEPKVTVTFEIKAGPVARLYSKDQLATAQANIASGLASACESTFRYWRFAPLDRPAYPLLEAWLASNPDGEYRVEGRLRRSDAAPPDAPWSFVLFKPGDLDAFGAPTAERWPEVVKRSLQDFLDQSRGSIMGMLQERAPLGTALHFVFPPPPDTVEKAQAVLALDWTRYSELATSDFVIWVDRQQGPARIHSTGVGRSAPYPGQPDYPAVWVQFRTWEETGGPVDIKDRLQQLGAVKPVAYYLERPSTPGGVLIHGQ